MKTKSIFFIMIAGAVFVACAKNKPADYFSDEQSEEITETEQYKQQDNSSTKWKDFAGTTYKATQYAGNSIENNYSFSYSSSGTGKFILFGTESGTHVVTDQMEFNIYKVSSDAECIYLYCSEMDTPIKIRIKGHSLYTYDGTERYEEWR